MKWREKHEGFKGQRIVVYATARSCHGFARSVASQSAAHRRGVLSQGKGPYLRAGKGMSRNDFYLLRGGETAVIAKLRAGGMEITQNQLLVVMASTPHVYGASKKSPWTIHWLHAIGNNVPLYLERLGVSRERPVVSLGGDV